MGRIPMPEGLMDRARDALGDPAPTKDAATIVVVRDGVEGIEAFLMRRQASMAFAAGMYVFPGGGVHGSDLAGDVPWVGPDAHAWASVWRCEPSLAQGLVVAAVRETFEETGVLLAGPDADTVLADTSGPVMVAARAALENHEIGFGDFLREQGLSLRADLVGAWGHWITPAFEPRRYDTRFFVAALPAGQVVGEMSREADRTLWAPLSQVLAAVDAGEAAMMPPTAVTCREIAPLSASTVLAAAAHRTIRTIEPTIVEVDGELFLDTGQEDDQ